jgi:hypothetical protein
VSKWSDQACDRLLRDVMHDPIRVAALFVQSGGTYSEMDDVDPWDAERDATKYAGPYPVVAHPPCSRWCQLARVNEARYGHKVGDDGGLFSFALDTVRCYGGVLEHPAETLAWPAHLLPPPNRRGGWSRSIDGGWVCHVEQGVYGHRARKATWLYAYGITPPSLNWGRSEPTATVSFMTNHGGGDLPRLSKREASKSPVAFARMLVDLAATAKGGA